jgi:hypothetical protein
VLLYSIVLLPFRPLSSPFHPEKKNTSPTKFFVFLYFHFNFIVLLLFTLISEWLVGGEVVPHNGTVWDELTSYCKRIVKLTAPMMRNI